MKKDWCLAHTDLGSPSTNDTDDHFLYGSRHHGRVTASTDIEKLGIQHVTFKMRVRAGYPQSLVLLDKAK
jgi:hypothetical protein